MTDFPMTLDAVNRLDEEDFVEAFGDVAEHSPWVAAGAAAARPFASRHEMIAAFEAAVDVASPEEQRALLVSHPDLAGKAAVSGDLTTDSEMEQAGAGLDRLTPEEFVEFTALNDAYRDRHGIPFIFAVRGATKHDILAAFGHRIDNPPEVEFQTALEQVNRIVRFRIEDRVAS
jgi:2-oxo-4-hydroxy-4-carboxy-5-ureidoimidazoline decarboxylase